jgi:hypothetical protein
VKTFLPPRSNLAELRQRKQLGQKIAVLTAYDYPTARLLDEAGLDLILVGDSLGMVVHGLPDTTGVTMDMMVLHTAWLIDQSSTAEARRQIAACKVLAAQVLTEGDLSAYELDWRRR